MVAVTFFGTEIFDNSKRHYTHSVRIMRLPLVCSTLVVCTLSPSLTPPKFTEIVNLECHRMDFEASNQW